MKEGTWVVCIDDQNWNPVASGYFNRLPVRNNIYRIRRIIPHLNGPNYPDGVALEGIFGNWKMFKTYDQRMVFEEYHFRMNRFAEISAFIVLEDGSEAFAPDHKSAGIEELMTLTNN